MTPLAATIAIVLLSAAVTLLAGYFCARISRSRKGPCNWLSQVPFACGYTVGCLLFAFAGVWLFRDDRFYSVANAVAFCLLACAVSVSFLILDVVCPSARERADADQPVGGARYRWLVLGIATIAFAVIASIVGVRFSILGFTGNPSLELGQWAGPLTVVWLVGAALAVKLLDGLDGAAHLVLIATCAAICYSTIGSSERFLSAFSLLTGSVAISALRFSLHPARLRLAGGGTLCIGFLFAMLIVFARQKSVAVVVFLAPVLAIAMVAAGAMLGFLEKQFTAEKK